MGCGGKVKSSCPVLLGVKAPEGEQADGLDGLNPREDLKTLERHPFIFRVLHHDAQSRPGLHRVFRGLAQGGAWGDQLHRVRFPGGIRHSDA